jgi:hypothetical protein
MNRLNNDNDSTSVYDHGIIPAEVAARKQREVQAFRHLPNQSQQINPESIQSLDGYTVDQEGY